MNVTVTSDNFVAFVTVFGGGKLFFDSVCSRIDSIRSGSANVNLLDLNR